MLSRYGHRAAAQRGPDAPAPGVPLSTRTGEIASPADSHVGMWPAYQGGKILVVKFGLCQLLDRLDELFASG